MKCVRYLWSRRSISSFMHCNHMGRPYVFKIHGAVYGAIQGARTPPIWSRNNAIFLVRVYLCETNRFRNRETRKHEEAFELLRTYVWGHMLGELISFDFIPETVLALQVFTSLL